MLTMPRFIAVAAIALFLIACVYVGYINEQLKGAIAAPHRAIVMIGFLIGAMATSRWMTDYATKLLKKRTR